jgi:hypothetical protein
MKDQSFLMFGVVLAALVLLGMWWYSQSKDEYHRGVAPSAHPGSQTRYGGYVHDTSTLTQDPIDYHTQHKDASLNSAPENPLKECEMNPRCARIGQSDVFTECRHSSGKAGFCKNGVMCCPYAPHEPPQYKHDINITGTDGLHIVPKTPAQIRDECEKRCGWQRHRGCYDHCLREFSS